jgi:hypothetical protein
MKKTRLTEIVREEIQKALLEFNHLNEDTLTEGPFIEGPLDFAYINGKVEKGILGKAIADATQEIKTTFPNIDPESAAKIITSKKSRTAEKTPESVKDALVKIDDAIEAQVGTFDDTALLKDLLNKGEIGKSAEEIERINQYIEPGEDGEVKTYVEKLGFPQTERAVKKALSGETPMAEPKTVTKAAPKTPETPKAEEPEMEEPEAPKATEKTPEAPKTEPKAKVSDEDKAAERAKKGGSKLDKIANDQDALLKIQKQAQEKMAELAKQLKNVEGSERDKVMDELKKINKVKAEVDVKIANLGF